VMQNTEADDPKGRGKEVHNMQRRGASAPGRWWPRVGCHHFAHGLRGIKVNTLFRRKAKEGKRKKEEDSAIGIGRAIFQIASCIPFQRLMSGSSCPQAGKEEEKEKGPVNPLYENPLRPAELPHRVASSSIMLLEVWERSPSRREEKRGEKEVLTSGEGGGRYPLSKSRLIGRSRTTASPSSPCDK